MCIIKERIKIITSMSDFDTKFNSIIYQFETQIDEYQDCGSGHVFNGIRRTVVKIYKAQFLRASSYIPTRFKSSINWKNTLLW
jgi:hypothetical protein